MNNLYSGNTFSNFWKIIPKNVVDTPQAAAEAAAQILPNGRDVLAQRGWVGLSEHILGEKQFGQNHWQLSRTKRLYYTMRPLLPKQVRPILRYFSSGQARDGFPLNWPVEDRYVRFQFDTVRHLLQDKGLDSLSYVHFWPETKRFAFVLTHDVESNLGQQSVREVVALEEIYGFRSSFNFVPEAYPIDHQLLSEIRERGFEVGVHGLKHDGKLFSSEERFRERAKEINRYLKAWGAVGFRSPLTHRHPEWMQALEIEYDSSFFDTDPFETIPGGTMSIWPFFIGRFVELPYTLMQDHTLFQTMGEKTPRLWLDKVAFVRKFRGMVLVNTHPDYLCQPPCLKAYEEFLKGVKEQGDFWHALPRDVAQWWRWRADCRPAQRDDGSWDLPRLPDGVPTEINMKELQEILGTSSCGDL